MELVVVGLKQNPPEGYSFPNEGMATAGLCGSDGLFGSGLSAELV